MPKDKLSLEEKNAELTKHRDLILATIDYYLDMPSLRIKTEDFDSYEHYKSLKRQTEEHFLKGRLAKLKQWFRDLTEMQVECRDFKFNKYLQEKTKYDIDIFDTYFKRVDKIVEKGKITTDNQFYDINIMVDQLCHEQEVDNERLAILNKLLSDYEKQKSKKTDKTNT